MVATALIMSEDQKAAINDMAAGIIAGLEKGHPYRGDRSTYFKLSAGASIAAAMAK